MSRVSTIASYFGWHARSRTSPKHGIAPPRDPRRAHRRAPRAPAPAVEIQLGKDDDKPFSWLLYHAGQHYRLRVPAFLVVVTNDPEVAAWAAGPFNSGMVSMRPLVISPAHVPVITDPVEAKRSLERTFLSGLLHADEPVAVDIGLALAAALDSSPDDVGLYYWDSLLAALGESLRSTLEMQREHCKPRSDWGKRFLAERERECEASAQLPMPPPYPQLVALLRESPQLVLHLLDGLPHADDLGGECLSSARVRFRGADPFAAEHPPLGTDLVLELLRPRGRKPFMGITVDVQLTVEPTKREDWLLHQAFEQYRLRAGCPMVVITNDREVAAWAREPLDTGSVVFHPTALGPAEVPAITSPEAARAWPEMALLSGLVHGKEPIAVDIGLALAHALTTSPAAVRSHHFDALLASLDTPLRTELVTRAAHITALTDEQRR